jgi:intracellular sulfur oxidation DsrE/DsrF family protein
MYSIISNAQTAAYKVVFDFTSKDTVNQQALLREMSLIKQYNPDAKVEAVIYGQGVSLVMNAYQPMLKKLYDYLHKKDVSFKVYAMSLKRQHIDESKLQPAVGTVPDVIYESSGMAVDI